MFEKGMLNQNRVLTMSNNRSCDALVINHVFNSTIVMGIKGDNVSTDIVFIKEIFNRNCKEVIEEVICICREFDVDEVFVDKIGYGKGFYDMFMANKTCSNIYIYSVDGVHRNDTMNEVILKIKEDIENCEIRFMQSYKCARTSYRKYFLGYSEVMNTHKETDILIDEMDNIQMNVNVNGVVKLEKKDREMKYSRFECLMVYYALQRI